MTEPCATPIFWVHDRADLDAAVRRELGDAIAASRLETLLRALSVRPETGRTGRRRTPSQGQPPHGMHA